MYPGKLVVVPPPPPCPLLGPLAGAWTPFQLTAGLSSWIALQRANPGAAGPGHTGANWLAPEGPAANATEAVAAEAAINAVNAVSDAAAPTLILCSHMSC